MTNLDNIRKKINEIDKEMASLFEQRMKCSEEIAKIKKINSLPIFDQKREDEVIKVTSNYIKDETLKKYYSDFIKNNIEISKSYQNEILSSPKKLTVNLYNKSYDIHLVKGGINDINLFFDLDRKVLLICDEGIPSVYIDKVKSQIKDCHLYIFPQGEKNKSLENYEKIIKFLTKNNFTRKDLIIALGGGVVSDLAGFVASSYKRGIDFYIIPTTLLAQIDASIGGKTALNIEGIKNVIGTFYQPKKVLIDSSVLSTLDKRQLHSGLVESIKMGVTSDERLFSLIENSDSLMDDIDEIIYRSLLVKKSIVEKDQYENNIRRILNFGHTIGHAIESCEKFDLLHGECVGLGMMYFINSRNTKTRIYNVLEKYNLPTKINITKKDLMDFILSDKKVVGDFIYVVMVDEIGSSKIENMSICDIEEYL